MKEYEPFSVSICVYHRDNVEWFKAAVDSILNQTVVPDEIVLVVDGPVPEEMDFLIRQYESLSVFKVVRHSENLGLGNARRTALEHCSHELVAMMDSDDISVPDRFEKQLAVFEEDEGVSVVGGQIAEFVDDPSVIIGYRVVPLESEQITKYIRSRNPLNHVSVMIKASDVLKVGGYLDCLYNEDYYLWIRMHLAGLRFSNVPDVLVNVRVGENMYKRRGGWKYFNSNLWIQKFMLKNRVNGPIRYTMNVAERFVVQVLLTNSMREKFYKQIARNRAVP